MSEVHRERDDLLGQRLLNNTLHSPSIVNSPIRPKHFQWFIVKSDLINDDFAPWARRRNMCINLFASIEPKTLLGFLT